MKTISATQARRQLSGLVEKAKRAPIRIASKRARAVLVSERDWNAIHETVYLLSIPGMRESIRAGLEEPIGKCDMKLEW